MDSSSPSPDVRAVETFLGAPVAAAGKAVGESVVQVIDEAVTALVLALLLLLALAAVGAVALLVVLVRRRRRRRRGRALAEVALAQRCPLAAPQGGCDGGSEATQPSATRTSASASPTPV